VEFGFDHLGEVVEGAAGLLSTGFDDREHAFGEAAAAFALRAERELASDGLLARLPLDKEVSMQEKYLVELTDEKRSLLREVVKKLKASSQKVKRANILIKADACGPRWTDARIAEAFDCRTNLPVR